MKAYYFVVVILAIVIYSCSQQEQEMNVPCEQVQDELILSLENLNDSIIATKPQSRGILRFLAVSSADMIGAWELGKIGATIGSTCSPGYGTLVGGGIGAVIGGVGASYVAYRSTCSIVVPYNYNLQAVAFEYANIKESINANEFFDKQIKLDFPKKNEEAFLVGVEHNLILDALRDGSAITRNNPIKIENGTQVLSEVEVQVLNSPDYIDRYNLVMQSVSTLDVEKYISENNTTGSQVIKLFMDVYNQYPETIDDVNLIINEYISKIESSTSLTDDEKQLIYNALAVAAYSFQYWDNEYSNSTLEN